MIRYALVRGFLLFIAVFIAPWAQANKNLRQYPSCVRILTEYSEVAPATIPTLTLAQLGRDPHVQHPLNPRRVADPQVIDRLPESFPPADRSDVVGIFAPTPEQYAQAYDFGVFPWREVFPGEVTWHSPEQRGVIRLDQPIKIRDTLRKFLMSNVEKNQSQYIMSVDHAFNRVVDEIQRMDRRNRPGQSQEWFHNTIADSYRRMHRLGRTHAIEVWDSKNGDLVGAILFTVANGYIAGESMFHKKIVEDGKVIFEVSDVGKMAGVALLMLAKQSGYKFLDTQTVKEGTFQSQSGGQLIPREEFLGLVEEAQSNPPRLMLPEGLFTIYFDKISTPEEAKELNLPIGQPNKNKPIIIQAGFSSLR